MTVLPFPSPAELARVERAGAHAVHESLLTPEARFAYPTTDLDVARLLEALEGGAAIVRASTGRWYFPDPHPLNASVSTIVKEAIRTGLVVHHRSDVLIPAAVHFRDPGPDLGDLVASAGYDLDPWQSWALDAVSEQPEIKGAGDRSLCRVAGEGMGPKRVRLVTIPRYVDCRACIDRL